MRRRTMLLAPLGLAACQVVPQRPYQPTRIWPLEVARPRPLPPVPRGPVLLLRDMQAAPGLQSRPLLALQADGSLRGDAYETWSAPPAEAAGAALRGWLAGAGLFAAVLAPGSRLNASLILEAELTALWAEPAAHRARASIGFNLLSQRGSDTALLRQSVAEGIAPLDGDGAAALSAAQLQALAACFSQIEQTIAAELPRAR